MVYQNGTITAIHSNLALSVQSDVPISKGSKIIQLPVHAGENQQWIMIGNQIKLKDHDLCLDCMDGSKKQGTNIIAWPHDGNSNQQWELVPYVKEAVQGSFCSKQPV